MVVCAAALTGCFAITIGQTRKEHLSSTVVETRVSSQRANISGTLCYLDQRITVTRRNVIPSMTRPFAGLELLLGGLTAFAPSPWNMVGLAFAADGLIALIYILTQDEKMSTRHTWEVSNETAACK